MLHMVLYLSTCILIYKKNLHDPDNHDMCDHSLRARHPEIQSQVGLRKHHYEQSLQR